MYPHFNSTYLLRVLFLIEKFVGINQNLLKTSCVFQMIFIEECVVKGDGVVSEEKTGKNVDQKQY